MRACLPVLAKQEGSQSRDHSSYRATESPPRVLDQKSHQNQDSTDGVADEHHLGYASKNPVHELQHHGLVWREEMSRGRNGIAAKSALVTVGGETFGYVLKPSFDPLVCLVSPQCPYWNPSFRKQLMHL